MDSAAAIRECITIVARATFELRKARDTCAAQRLMAPQNLEENAWDSRLNMIREADKTCKLLLLEMRQMRAILLESV